MKKKIIIVGGVAGGASFAARMRRLDEDAEITMFERGEYISFANCGLPYHIGGEIKERNRLIVQTPENFKSVQNVDVKNNSDVTSIDTDAKEVYYTDKKGNGHKQSYDYLLLSPGATPLRPPIPGIDNEKIYTLRNIPDMDKIKAVVDSGNVKKAVVIGGGFIGIEVAENLKHRGIDVTLVELADQIFAPADQDMASYVEREMILNGVNIVTGEGASSFENKGNQVSVKLGSGKELDAELVILAIGVKPDTTFLKDSKIELSDRGAIIVDDSMRTNVDGVLAVGDAIQVTDFVTDAKVLVPLAGPANRQGRIAADTVHGLTSTYKKTQGTAICKVFGLTAAVTGLNEKNAKRSNIECIKSYTHSFNHAGYYPGASMMSVKILFAPKTGKLLGAQIMGQDGVDRRIDVFANAIRQELTIYDLIDMELAYAPPYGSAKDAVNMAGFVAENIIAGRADMIYTEELDKEYDPEKMEIIDVRSEEETIIGYLRDSKLIPHGEIRDRLSELDKDKEQIVYCGVGLRGYLAARILQLNGYKVRNLAGGFNTYSMIHLNDEDNLKVLPQGTCDATFDKSEGSPVIEEYKSTAEDVAAVLDIDACGLQCPGPILKLKDGIEQVNHGEIIKVSSNDPGFAHDIPAWCRNTGNTLISMRSEGRINIAAIKKGNPQGNTVSTVSSKKKTIVVFSDDFDKLMATFIIANGAAAMNDEVVLFFTFWGLNALRKKGGAKVDKNFIEKAFGWMMPKGVEKTELSKMNFGGLGTKLMGSVMKKKQIMTLPELIAQARKNNVRLVACAMSMDMMGIKEEELVDGVEIGGVGMYLGEASDSAFNLFI